MKPDPKMGYDRVVERRFENTYLGAATRVKLALLRWGMESLFDSLFLPQVRAVWRIPVEQAFLNPCLATAPVEFDLLAILFGRLLLVFFTIEGDRTSRRLGVVETVGSAFSACPLLVGLSSIVTKLILAGESSYTCSPTVDEGCSSFSWSPSDFELQFSCGSDIILFSCS